MGLSLCSDVMRTKWTSKQGSFVLEEEIEDEVDEPFPPVIQPLEDAINKMLNTPIISPSMTPSPRRTPSPRMHLEASPNRHNLNRLSPGGRSLKQRIDERHRSLSPMARQVSGLGEREAKDYEDFVEEDTWHHLTDTLRIATSILQKGDDMSEELNRQVGVTSQANSDILACEEDLAEMGHMLKGMKSVKGKVSNMVFGKMHRLHTHGFRGDPGAKYRRRRSQSMPSSLIKYRKSQEYTRQQQIAGGLSQLNLTLDIIESQQLDIAEELEKQEGSLQEFNSNLSRMDDKIKSENDIMRSIRMG